MENSSECPKVCGGFCEIRRKKGRKHAIIPAKMHKNDENSAYCSARTHNCCPNAQKACKGGNRFPFNLINF